MIFFIDLDDLNYFFNDLAELKFPSSTICNLFE